MPQALLAAPVVLALVLAGGGLLKLGDDDAATAREWDALSVPAPLNRRWARRAHPWAEIALALALLVLPGAPGVLAGAAAVGLCLAYTVLIAHALRSPGAVCSCFGASHQTPLTGWTLVRNILLTVLAALCVLSAMTLGAPVAEAMADGGVLAWLLAVVVAMATVQLVSAPPSAPVDAPVGEPVAEPSDGGTEEEGQADYLRTLTPHATFRAEDGRVLDLVSVTRERAHLLLFLSPGCAPCETVARRVPEWAAAMPQLAVRIVTSVPFDVLKDRSPAWLPYAVRDEDGSAARMLRCVTTPSAVLLGTDGMLAGGPVTGEAHVVQLGEEVLAQLSEPQ